MTLVMLIILLSILPVYLAETCSIPNCAQCNGNSVCDSCKDGYYLESGYCTPCPSNCSKCTDVLHCQTCKTSYWNPGEQCSKPCSGCSSSGCEDTQGRCYECIAGRYGTVCDKDCSLCMNVECGRLLCISGCIDGYVQITSGSGYSDCHHCTNNCIKCSNATYCTQCEEGSYSTYYRKTNGRGSRRCTECSVECTQCTSIDQCPEWCNIECIKQGCEVPESCVTTPTTPPTTASKSPTIDSTEITQTVTTQTACPVECIENCDVHGKCLDTTTRFSKSDGFACKCMENNYFEAFGQGIGTGIGIVVAIEALVAIVVYLCRRPNCFDTMNRAKSSADSREHRVYVNTQKQSASSDRPEYEDVEANSEIRVTMSEEEVDVDREYISLGERQAEPNYSDLQQQT